MYSLSHEKKDRSMCCRCSLPTCRWSPYKCPWRSATDAYIQELELTSLMMKVCTLKTKPTVFAGWSSRPGRRIKRETKWEDCQRVKEGDRQLLHSWREQNRKRKKKRSHKWKWEELVTIIPFSVDHFLQFHLYIVSNFRTAECIHNFQFLTFRNNVWNYEISWPDIIFIASRG